MFAYGLDLCQNPPSLPRYALARLRVLEKPLQSAHVRQDRPELLVDGDDLLQVDRELALRAAKALDARLGRLELALELADGHLELVGLGLLGHRLVQLDQPLQSAQRARVCPRAVEPALERLLVLGERVGGVDDAGYSFLYSTVESYAMFVVKVGWVVEVVS